MGEFSNDMISILMPVKNEESHLDECITSILNQTEQNWELIAIDDNSTDLSYSILTRYAAMDARIHVFRSSGQGIIKALRMAMEKSSGDFITRMDADDIMLPYKLEALKKALLHKGVSHVATGLVEYFSEDSLGDGYTKYALWLNGLTMREENFNNLYKECPIPSPCWMVHRSDLIKCGGFESNVYPEDYDLCFRFASAQFKVAAVPKIIHRWRDYAERTSRNDPHYADATFLDIKLNYFLKLHYLKDRNLVVWGLGKKGKYVAKFLIDRNIPFNWICNNPNKIGKNIYGTHIESDTLVDSMKNVQIVVLVAAPEDQLDIRTKMTELYYRRNTDYFFFC